MFTGIIEGLGTITAIRASGQGRRMTITSDFVLDQTGVGDSIAVNGACLTAVVVAGRRFEVDVSPETLEKTTLGLSKVAQRVNLERAMHLSDRLDGHLVSGHIDGTGVIKARQASGNASIVSIGVSESLSRYMIRKGSVAVDGISLTINEFDAAGFSVSVIPHTTLVTTIGFKQVGEAVNIETDMIGKYVERFIGGRRNQESGNGDAGSGIDMQFLAKTGFL
jgi:riboflavin synthase